jgi:hypothetical protein
MSATSTELAGWFAGRVPDGWFAGPPTVTVDADEILVVGAVHEPAYPDDADDRGRAAARLGRVKQFREDTRADRMRIADEAEHRFGRKVSWGATCGDDRFVFTNVSVPVMTRLRLPERRVLDTLIEAGVARSRSEALAWCVRLVGEHESEWLAQLQEALGAVQQVRDAGPKSRGNP